MKTNIKAVARAQAGNANHHLWNNHGPWWCHLTLHLPDHTKQRLRLSLGTGDLSLAHRLRDSTLALVRLGQRQQARWRRQEERLRLPPID